MVTSTYRRNIECRFTRLRLPYLFIFLEVFITIYIIKHPIYLPEIRFIWPIVQWFKNNVLTPKKYVLRLDFLIYYYLYSFKFWKRIPVFFKNVYKHILFRDYIYEIFLLCLRKSISKRKKFNSDLDKMGINYTVRSLRLLYFLNKHSMFTLIPVGYQVNST